MVAGVVSATVVDYRDRGGAVNRLSRVAARFFGIVRPDFRGPSPGQGEAEGPVRHARNHPARVAGIGLPNVGELIKGLTD